MSPTPQDELAASLARSMVARVARHELPMFRAASRAYFANPDRALRVRPGDEMLGFGADSMVALTPYALVIAHEVIDVLSREGADVGGLLGPALDATGVVARLSPEQLDRVREMSLQKARQLALDEDNAVLLAEAVTGSLVGPSS